MKTLSVSVALELHARLTIIERSLFIICKPIIEAYGWSSKLGCKAEKISSGFGVFYSGYIALEDHIGYAMTIQNPRHFQISTEGGLSHMLSAETHFLTGCILMYARNDLQIMGVNISNEIGKTKPLTKSIFKLVPFLDGLRSNLDDEYIKEHRVGIYLEGISPYYPNNK